MAPISGQPFLTYLFRQLIAARVSQVIVCTGYLSTKISSHFGQSFEGLTIRYSEESSPLGTAGALRLAFSLLESDPVLVLNGDSYCDANLTGFVEWHRAHKATCSLLLTKVDDARRFGRVLVGEDGRITAFAEKSDRAGSAWINAGIYLLDPQMLAGIPEGQATSLEREWFPRWIGQGLWGYPSHGRFLDIGTPESLAQAEEFFRSVS
jgi:NDP-sugar pyrophosphorylase family protein